MTLRFSKMWLDKLFLNIFLIIVFKLQKNSKCKVLFRYLMLYFWISNTWLKPLRYYSGITWIASVRYLTKPWITLLGIFSIPKNFFSILNTLCHPEWPIIFNILNTFCHPKWPTISRYFEWPLPSWMAYNKFLASYMPFPSQNGPKILSILNTFF